MRNRRPNYETDDETFSADAYKVAGWGAGIAFRVFGWETEPTEDTEWDGIEQRTGQVVVVMIGDDARHLCDPDDLEPIERESYCGVCGQVGCSHDGLTRD